MEFLKNLCETRGNALDVYIAAHGPGEVLLNGSNLPNIKRAEYASEFLKNVSDSKPKYESVYDDLDAFNPDVGGRVFVKSKRDCAGIYLDSEKEFSDVLEFLKNIDAFAVCSENNPDGNGVMLTVDWRVEHVKF